MFNDKVLLAVLYAETGDDALWVKSLRKLDFVHFDSIDLRRHDWLDLCNAKKYDCFLAKAPGHTNLIKQMFDERIGILVYCHAKPVYPSVNELLIYENKKLLAYWLQANGIPHPQTKVFYLKQEAKTWVESATFPLVAKTNIGSSGKGVRILRNMDEARRYIHIAFRRGLLPSIGPNLRTGSILGKIRNMIKVKGILSKRFKTYSSVSKDPQRYIIFQDFIAHSFEWRVVNIDGSFFAHKKLLINNKASGSLLKEYSNPPLSLLDFTRELCIAHDLTVVSIDLFETPNGYLVNEVQTYFGQSDAFQMRVDGRIGRYRYIDDKWCFEEGDYNTNECYDLRVQHVLRLLNRNGG